ncbi:MAG: cation:proton antiporter [Candidatus Woesearchaeota archaeon]|nr:cation:proton antiporter [Candidatus Woesearchaeota archaeon]
MDFVFTLVSIGLLLLFAKLLGELSERFGVSSLVGEIIAGIMLGPVIGLVSLNNFIDNFVMLGIILLLFLAGMEVKFDEIKNNIYAASALAASAGILSFIFGMIVGLIFFNDFIVGFAIGTVLASTSNGTLFSLLMKSHHFNTSAGKLIIASSICDDVLGIIALSFFSFFGAHEAVSWNKISAIFFVVVGLYLVVFTAGERLIKVIIKYISRFKSDEVLFAIPFGITILMAYFTENIGVSLAAGAFLAGMTMANSEFTPIIESKIKILGNGFLIPLFYASIGTLLVFRDVNIYLVAAIFAAAVFGKVIGSALVAKLLRLHKSEIKIVCIALIPRGNENMALAQLVFALGLVAMSVYTSLLIALVLTVIASAILMKLL